MHLPLLTNQHCLLTSSPPKIAPTDIAGVSGPSLLVFTVVAEFSDISGQSLLFYISVVVC
jgi:hypothetical protein